MTRLTPKEQLRHFASASEAMKEDNRMIFRAVSEVQKAMDYIMADSAQADRMAAE